MSETTRTLNKQWRQMIGWEKLSPREKVERSMQIPNSIKKDNFILPFLRDQLRLRDVTLLTDTTARVTFEIDVDPFYSNPAGSLQGGAQGSMFDLCTSVALAPIARPGFWMTHVSRVLTVTFLRPAAMNEPLVVDCEVVHVGKRLAIIKAVMKRKRDGAIISTCEHNKASTDLDVAAKI